ncbi:MAG: hypothetical protein MJ102_05725 [Clostridia bacterium]|nr:hypothetical protein [Clostridia bacterium]
MNNITITASLEYTGLPFSVWTLICAVLLPVLCAAAVFVFLRRASISRKLICYFVTTPIYVAVTVFVFGDLTDIAERILPRVHEVCLPFVGFISALTVGILYLSIASLICGAGIMRRGGAVANAITTIICFILSGCLTYASWTFCADPASMEYSIYSTLPLRFILPTGTAGIVPEAILNSGIDLISAIIFILFLIAYFLCFLSTRNTESTYREDDLPEDEYSPLNEDVPIDNRRRMRSLRREMRDEEKGNVSADKAAEFESCCAYCEHARRLTGDSGNSLCDFNGIVNASHICRKFVYDPLKRMPSRVNSEFSAQNVELEEIVELEENIELEEKIELEENVRLENNVKLDENIDFDFPESPELPEFPIFPDFS